MILSSGKTDQQYYHGFDYLRALFSFFVLAMHHQLFNIIDGNYAAAGYTITLGKIVVFNIFTLAVPGFLMISLFLFIKKKRSTLAGNLKRLKPVLALYIFWVALWILIRRQTPEPGFIRFILFLVRGGYSVFYFFFTLLCLQLLACLLMNLNPRINWVLLVLSLLANYIYPRLNMVHPCFRILVAYYNPLSFLPCLFAAQLLVYYENKIHQYFSLLLVVLGVLFLAATALEWLTLVHPHHLQILIAPFPTNARPSPAIGTVLLFIIALNVKQAVPRPIKIISNFSLGLKGN